MGEWTHLADVVARRARPAVALDQTIDELLFALDIETGALDALARPDAQL